jgi:hypothetical protein
MLYSDFGNKIRVPQCFLQALTINNNRILKAYCCTKGIFMAKLTMVVASLLAFG